MQHLAPHGAVIKGRTPSPRTPELADTFAPALARTEHAGPIFRQRYSKAWLLGPRIMGELIAELAEIANPRARVDARLEVYSKINPQTVQALNCGGWPTELTPVPTQRVA